MAEIRFLEGMPPDVAERVSSVGRRADEAMLARNWEEAFSLAEETFRLILESQREGHRFHKGGAAQQAGIALLNLERYEEARRWIEAAFVEDVLSRGEESPNNLDELGRPSTFTLLFTFGIQGPILATWSIRLRRRQAEGKLWRDPFEAVQEEPSVVEVAAEQLAAEPAAQVAQAQALVAVAPVRVPQWRVPGLFGTRFEDRVFVGGVYSGQFIGALVAIRDEVRQHGFDGVLAAEFKREGATAESMYTDALLMLRSCHRAIFEVSDDRGQLMEFEEVDRYHIKDILVVHNSSATGKLSTMVVGKCSTLGITPRVYSGPEELIEIVRDWLTGLEADLALPDPPAA